MQTSKPATESKTIIAAVLTELVCAAADNIDLIQPLIPDDFFKYVAFGFPLLCVVLRKLTYQPVHFLTPPDTGAGGME